MAAANLLALIDDIATLLDDVAAMSKVAAKKTAGVLGDDLALNAQQVAGVRADRELPVVWAVAKGSFKNKLILVPLALLISAVSSILITFLLMLGGAFLCFEGVEKVVHTLFHGKDEKQVHKDELRRMLDDQQADILAFEKRKIKGAIRTDFILSAEIIVITLGAVQAATFGVQVAVVSVMAIAITIGVYGIVAGIVKLDDAGLYLTRQSNESIVGKVRHFCGMALIVLSPYLMKALSFFGTIAMFAVGGGILVHGLPFLHHARDRILESLGKGLSFDFSALGFVSPMLVEISFGFVAGLILVAMQMLFVRLKSALGKSQEVV